MSLSIRSFSYCLIGVFPDHASVCLQRNLYSQINYTTGIFSITVLIISKKNYPLQIEIIADSRNSKNMKSATKKSVLFFAEMVSHFATASGLLSLTRRECVALEGTPKNQLGEK